MPSLSFSDDPVSAGLAFFPHVSGNVNEEDLEMILVIWIRISCLLILFDLLAPSSCSMRYL